MKRFDKILAPTDLSPESLDVVKYAGHLAKAEGARLTVLHVVHSTSFAYSGFAPPLDLSAFDADLVKAAEEELKRWAKTSLRGVERVDLMVRIGLADEVVESVAEEIGAGVIVMATHGRRGLKRALLGSVTEWVVRRAPCPVLVIKPPPQAAARSRKSSKKRSKKK
jgi:nucleotide-binding universal stress UspA family protein